MINVLVAERIDCGTSSKVGFVDFIPAGTSSPGFFPQTPFHDHYRVSFPTSGLPTYPDGIGELSSR
jgi:hypothetical protein